MAQLQTHTPQAPATTPVGTEFWSVLQLSRTMKRELVAFMQRPQVQTPSFSVQGASVYFVTPVFVAQADRATLVKFQDRIAGKYDSEITRQWGADFLVFHVTGTAKLGLEGTMKVAKEALEGESIEEVDNWVAWTVANIIKN